MNVARCVAAFCFTAAVACGTNASSGGAERAAPRMTLDGAWEATLRLERPVVLTADQAHEPREIRGQFAFVRNHSIHDDYESIGVPAYRGTYEIDFGSFGFEQRVRGGLPAAIARLGGEDSVTISLDPTDDGTSLLLRGTLRKDSVVGAWALLSRGAGGGGSFVLWRRAPSNP